MGQRRTLAVLQIGNFLSEAEIEVSIFGKADRRAYNGDSILIETAGRFLGTEFGISLGPATFYRLTFSPGGGGGVELWQIQKIGREKSGEFVVTSPG